MRIAIYLADNLPLLIYLLYIFLQKHNVRYDTIIFDAPKGERILVNDTKPDGLVCAYAINTIRDEFPNLLVDRSIDKIQR